MNKELLNLVNKALEIDKKENPSEYHDTVKIITGIIGTWDKASRYYINDEYETESSSYIRSPSRSWNLSKYKHVFTKKYLTQLKVKLESN